MLFDQTRQIEASVVEPPCRRSGACLRRPLLWLALLAMAASCDPAGDGEPDCPRGTRPGQWLLRGTGWPLKSASLVVDGDDVFVHLGPGGVPESHIGVRLPASWWPGSEQRRVAYTVRIDTTDGQVVGGVGGHKGVGGAGWLVGQDDGSVVLSSRVPVWGFMDSPPTAMPATIGVVLQTPCGDVALRDTDVVLRPSFPVSSGSAGGAGGGW